MLYFAQNCISYFQIVYISNLVKPVFRILITFLFEQPPVVHSGYQSEECEGDVEAEEEEEEVVEPVLEAEEEKSPVPPPDQEQPVHDAGNLHQLGKSVDNIINIFFFF